MIKTMTSVLLAAVLAGLTAQPDAIAQQEAIYKWVDAEGVVHYTARPPEDVEFEKIGVEISDPEETSSGEGEMAGDGQAAEDDGMPPAQPEMAEAEPDPEVVAERCQQARSNIENLTQHANVMIRGEDGEQRRISEAERQQMLEDAQAFVDQWCDEGG
jgi:hypothetical protein